MIQKYQAIFRNKKRLAPDVYSLFFDLPNRETIIFTPGQYMILFCPQDGKESARRLFSIVNAVQDNTSIELVVKIIPQGIASEYFMKMQPGESVLLQGPAGLFVLKQTPHKKILIATGTGIAPMLSMLRSQNPDSSADILLLWGLRKKDDVYLLEELNRLKQKNPKFDFRICLSQEEIEVIKGENHFLRGRVLVPLQKLIENETSLVEYYVCGNRTMVEDVRMYLLGKGIQKEHIIVEKY